MSEISARFDVSTATARRDVAEIASAGLAIRTHGGLPPPDFTLGEARYSRKAEKAVGVKARLGRAAAALLPEAGTVFVEAGTTCLEVGRAILDRPDVRIFTNSIPLLSLAGGARATLNAIGGEVRPMSFALTGGLAQSWLERLRFDAKAHGYRLTDEGYRLSPVRISRKEAFGFALARKLLAAFEGTPLNLEMRSVLARIAESLEGEISVEPEWLSEQVYPPGISSPQIITAPLAPLGGRSPDGYTASTDARTRTGRRTAARRSRCASTRANSPACRADTASTRARPLRRLSLDRASDAART